MPGLLTGSTTGIMDRQKGKGTASQSFLQRIGNSAAQAAGSGNVAAFVGSQQPGSLNTNNVLYAATLPANLFDIAGRGVQITGMGQIVGNASFATQVAIYVGATTATVGSAIVGGTQVAASSSYITAGTVGFAISAQLFKYGAAGSNTQWALHQAAVIGATNGSLTAPSSLTLTESGQIIIAITGNVASGGATTQITLNFAEVFATN